MAEAKSKKNSDKVFDIAKPGKAAPSSTSRPVIITNRPVLKDPMVIQVNSDADSDDVASTEPTGSTNEMKHKVDVRPLHIDLSEVLPAAESAKKEDKKEAESVEEKPAKSDESDESAEPEELKEKEKEEADITEDAKTEALAPLKPKAPDEPAVDPKTAEGTKPTKEKEQQETESSSPDEDVPAEETPAEDSPLPSTEEAEPSIDEDGTPVLSESEAKVADEAKKKAEEQEKIITSGEYYLPINAVRKRRTKRNVVLGTLLLVVLVALAALAAWDAGLFSIPNVQAPTDFL